MDKFLFNKLCNKYSPIITKLINENIKFYRFHETIRWQFGFDERVAIVASCNKTNNILTINVASVEFAFQRNEPLTIEYFLLHEIRHIYQHLEIADYKNCPSKCIDPLLAKKWAEEEANYVTALNNQDHENAAYFQQDIEFDAYVFAYAVLKYKYKNLPDYIFRPKAYGQEFDDLVDKWCKTFENEKL